MKRRSFVVLAKQMKSLLHLAGNGIGRVQNLERLAKENIARVQLSKNNNRLFATRNPHENSLLHRWSCVHSD